MANGANPDIKVLVADKNQVIQQALAEVIELVPGMVCVGTASSGAEALRLIVLECPDAVIVDGALTDMTGPAALRRMREVYPEAHFIGFTIHPDSDVAESLRTAGADAVVSKAGGAVELLDVIRSLGLAPEPAREACEERAADAA